MTPRELRVAVEATGERERGREKEMWRRFAFLAAETVNISGKSVRRPMKAKDYFKFDDEDKGKKGLTPTEIEVRRRQMAETAKLHKSKFWKLLKDESVRKVTEN